MRMKAFFTMFLILLFTVIAPTVSAEYDLNMTEGATEISQSVYDLHMTIFNVCVVIAIVVFGVMFWSIIRYRKSRGAKSAQFHESTTVEIIWTIIPVIILVLMAIPATSTMIKLYDSSEPDLDIKITGYQWKWHYDYGKDDISFFSNLSTPQEQIQNKAPKGEHYLLEVDQPLVLPIHKKIRFIVTSNDVIHSWWVPALAIKRDAIPGFINTAWAKIDKPGIYRGQCAELCGKSHGFMPIVVKAVTETDYLAWKQDKNTEAMKDAAMSQKSWTLPDLVARGEKVYATNCAVCHQPTGVGLPGVFPALKGSAIATGPVEDHIHRVVFGKSGTAMQAFGKQLSDLDLAAVITYERNAWRNNTKDLVSPQDIATAKKK